MSDSRTVAPQPKPPGPVYGPAPEIPEEELYRPPPRGDSPSLWMDFARWLAAGDRTSPADDWSWLGAGFIDWDAVFPTPPQPAGQVSLTQEEIDRRLVARGINPSTGQPFGFDPTQRGDGTRYADPRPPRAKEKPESNNKQAPGFAPKPKPAVGQGPQWLEKLAEVNPLTGLPWNINPLTGQPWDFDFAAGSTFARPRGAKPENGDAPDGSGGAHTITKRDKPPVYARPERDTKDAVAARAEEDAALFRTLHHAVDTCPPPTEAEARAIQDPEQRAAALRYLRAGISQRELEESKLWYEGELNSVVSRLTSAADRGAEPAIAHAAMVAEYTDLVRSGQGDSDRRDELALALRTSQLRHNDERLALAARLDREIDRLESVRDRIRRIGREDRPQKISELRLLLCKYWMLIRLAQALAAQAEHALRAVEASEVARFATADVSESALWFARLATWVFPESDKGWFAPSLKAIYVPQPELENWAARTVNQVLRMRTYHDYDTGSVSTDIVRKGLQLADARERAVKEESAFLQKTIDEVFARVRLSSGLMAMSDEIGKMDALLSAGSFLKSLGKVIAGGAKITGRALRAAISKLRAKSGRGAATSVDEMVETLAELARAGKREAQDVVEEAGSARPAKAAPARETRTTAAETLSRNKGVGKRAELVVEQRLRDAGIPVRATQVPVKTPFGYRVIDIIVEVGGDFFGIEVKSGRAIRNLAQRAKDAWINLSRAAKTGPKGRKAGIEAVRGTITIREP